MTVCSQISYIMLCVCILHVLLHATELTIAAERKRTEWMKKSGIRRNRASGR